MATDETPAAAPERDGRRALFDTVLRHGSEERTSTTTPTIEEGSARRPTPQLRSATDWIRPVLPVTGDRSSEERTATETALPTEHAWTKLPITSWTHELTLEFLEYHKVTSQGLKVAISLNWNGRTLREIIEDAECDSILSEDMGISGRLHRLTIIAAVKAGMEFKGAAPTGTLGRPHSDQIKQSLLAGEKALEIPLIPKGAPGQALPSQASWKTFMTTVQGWGELASEDYSYIVSAFKSDPNQDVERVYTNLGATEKRIDLVLGTLTAS